MKREKELRIKTLINLYFDYIIQKSTLIVLILSFALMTGIFLLISKNLNVSSYIEQYNEIHILYIRQALLIIQIFNSVIITTFVIQLGIHSESFDVLFVSYISRKKICITKIIVLLIISFFIALFEMLIINIVGNISFNMYIISYKEILSSLYIFISIIFEGLIGIVICSIASNMFIPMSILFIFVIIKILCNNSIKFYNLISSIFPILGYNRANTGIESSPIYIGVIWIILLGVLYNSIYSLKNLK